LATPRGGSTKRKMAAFNGFLEFLEFWYNFHAPCFQFSSKTLHRLSNHRKNPIQPSKSQNSQQNPNNPQVSDTKNPQISNGKILISSISHWKGFFPQKKTKGKIKFYHIFMCNK
jgi:hypothetical protein